MPCFGIVSASLEKDWHSRRLLEACAARGEVRLFRPEELALGSRGVTARGDDASACDAWLLARALGERGDADFQLTVYQALGEAAVVVNQPGALLAAEDKPRTSWLLARAGIPTPAFACAQSLDEATAALERLGVAMVKPPYGSLGLGIERVAAGEVATLARMLREHGVLYLQEWIPPRGRRRRARDLRLFVVGDDVGAAMERLAPPGAVCTNVYLGGSARAYDPPPRAAEIAVAAARALGLTYAGVDLLETDDGFTVIEVNGTPRWDALQDVTGCDMAEAIVGEVIRLCKKETTWRRRRPRRVA